MFYRNHWIVIRTDGKTRLVMAVYRPSILKLNIVEQDSFREFLRGCSATAFITLACH